MLGHQRIAKNLKRARGPWMGWPKELLYSFLFTLAILGPIFAVFAVFILALIFRV